MKKGSRGREQIGEGEKIQRIEEEKRKKKGKKKKREFSGFILQHRHPHILPYFIIIVFFNTVDASFYSNC